ncbi:MAG: hypothetical protein ABW001_02630 [Mycobacterium sp.]
MLLHAEVAEFTDNEFFASWQRSASQLWQRYTDTEMAVILDFLTDTAKRLRTRTEAVTGSRREASTDQERRDARRRVD